MNTTEISDLIINIIRAYLLEENIQFDLSDEILEKLFLKLKEHDLTHIAGVVFSKNKTDNRYEKFINSQYVALMRYERNKSARDNIYDIFEKNKIPFLPLKGAVICDYYYESWHRTSCDIDILVHKTDVEMAVEHLHKKLGFTFSGKSSHDISLFSPDGVHLELHYDFHERELLTSDVWSVSEAINGKMYHYAMSNEMFLLYHIAHMAKHFKYAGCGIRPFMDLWIIKNNIEYNTTDFEELVCSKGLKKFSDFVFELIEIWFGNGKNNETSENISMYVLGSGIYGKLENMVVIGQINKGDKIKYALSRIFLRYDVLKYAYPIIEKHLWLFPFCQIHRWFKIIKTKGIKRVSNEFEINQNIDNNKQKRIEKLLIEMEIL